MMVERQKLIDVVNSLPDEALLELAGFLNYLCHKSTQSEKPDDQSSNFLLAIANLGSSGQQDVSERDEEILRHEIDPVYGWHLESKHPYRCSNYCSC